ncbi:MAG: ABC transporter substrate-binding protein [Anaerolineales bacterium]
MSKKVLSLVSFITLLALLLTACGPAATEEPLEEPTETEAVVETEEPMEEPEETEEVVEPEEPAGDVTQIRWFIGLGAGGNPEEVEKEEAFVEAFNAAYGDQYELVMDVVANETAYDVLKTQIASGDCPDIVGPVGVRGLWSFEGAWLDLAPYIAEYDYDLSDFNESLVEFYELGPQGQVGLPFAVYPSALFYNKDLFDEAGLEYPPHEFGADYMGEPWTFEALRDIAMFLTVDANGNDATMEDFDPENIVQFGFHPMWTDIRGRWTYFGAGNFVDRTGNAVLPAVWEEAAKWYYAGMWEDHFVPNDNYVNSDLLGQGNTFGSGNVAMNPNHTWYTCCTEGVNWDVAAIPSHDGNITAKMHADTFAIPECSANPNASFEVLGLMLGEFAPDLLQVYGGLPARASLQAGALTTMQENFPDADLNVFIEAMNYPDNPNHEAGMPNFNKASDRYTSFGSLYRTDPNLDLEAELDKLTNDLQAIFDEVD